MNDTSLPSGFDVADAAQPPLRAAITAAYRVPEPVCVPPLIAAAMLEPDKRAQAQSIATVLVTALRAKQKPGGVEALIREYALSSDEGVALMCLAEALLRIPDPATRDALIRDKIGGGDWRAHLGHSPSLFVNAATWGLVVTGRLVETVPEKTLSNALIRLLARGGEPVIRRSVDLAMRMMGEQFVTGETIEAALSRAKTMEALGFRYSYDMLGEAAVTAADAARYDAAYVEAIHAIGAASGGRGIYEGPGISIKLSALHPRYARAQKARVMAELLPRLLALAVLARRYDIGLNIDAEEAERLDLSLDLLTALCEAPALAGWHGIGFVVQAYQKRAFAVLDYLIDLARRTGHRLMIRLVKGAYWDSEIKRAQVEGLAGFPVFTRKIYTDVSYIACAKTLLAAGADVYPQFATHNAMTLASIYALAGDDADYEFQCLHGMGEPLYEEVVGGKHLCRPCRIYAPVGTHETLLAYLVRRLLENGANSSFVNRISDPAVSIAELVEDPAMLAEAVMPAGAPHDKIRLPADLFGDARRNSAGLDLSDETVLAGLEHGLPAAPLAGGIADADAGAIEAALRAAAASGWGDTPPRDRADILNRAADLLQADMRYLITLLVREAGKTIPNAVGEIREAVDFLRYYASQCRDFSNDTHLPLGPVACISPWNFPLAIFTGQVAAALAAGNPVLAKPAEETPFIAAYAVALLHKAGVPDGALTLLQGDGVVGAALVSDQRVRGVVFTGSTAVARLIQRELAGRNVRLIAETGGQNAMIVDSSALAEQVVADVLASAFDSAGQRCSALRLLCVQEDAAPRIMTMLKGAMAELSVGNPECLFTDIGPVISEPAQRGILAYIETMRARGHAVHQLPLTADCAGQNFVPPTVIEIGGVADLGAEIFGPVLHVMTFKAAALDALVDAINATGYGLTFGLHTRIDATVARVTDRIHAGNIYVNRNIVGAVVGVQPFGGHGLSGTGPKAGGPFYLRALLAQAPAWDGVRERELAGPVGERNLWRLVPRERIMCVAETEAGRHAQAAAVREAGGTVVTNPDGPCDAVLLEGDAAAAQKMAHRLAALPGPIVPLYALSRENIAAGQTYPVAWLMLERCISTNTAAAGGNASLMQIG
jgi:RHH-type proline utilization regulon transcriptional repressor/proline dehydrogenase/delta 1-pyrroline-5-carboxylate dehydrogenase